MAIEFSLIPPAFKNVPFTPNLDKIKKFASGDIGVTSGIFNGILYDNIRKCKNNQAIETFIKFSKIVLPKELNEYKNSDGKIVIPFSDIDSTSTGQFAGLFAMEKALIQSIFETQKPYMEIIGFVSTNLVLIEDIVARVLALADSSLKPKYNPKAIGYQQAFIKSENKKLANLAKPNKPANVTQPNTTSNTNGTTVTGANGTSANLKYEIIDIDYSTGEFIEGVNYETIYRDIYDVPFDVGSDNVPPDAPEISLPEFVSFGIYDSAGTELAPPTWLTNAPKFYGNFPRTGNFKFVWKRGESETTISLGTPDPDVFGGGWERTEERIFEQPDITTYTNYYSNFIDNSLSTSEGSDSDKAVARAKLNDIVSKNVSNILSGTVEDTPFAKYNGLFALSGSGYLPKQITFNGVPTYVDPQTDYDFRLIKIDSTLDISFLTNNTTNTNTKILRFVNTSLNVSMLDNSDFSIAFEFSDQNGNTEQLLTTNLNLANPVYLNTDKLSIDNLSPSTKLYTLIVSNKPPTGFKETSYDIDTIIKANNNASGGTTTTPESIKVNKKLEDAILQTNASPTIQSTNGGVNLTLDDVAQLDTKNGLSTGTNYDYKTDYIEKDQLTGKFKYLRGYITKDANGKDVITKVAQALGFYYIKFNNKKLKVFVSSSSLIERYWLYENNLTILDKKLTSVGVSQTVDKIVVTNTDLSTGFIRVASGDARFGELISKNQITNAQLSISNGYAPIEDYTKTGITQLYRYRTSFEDTKTFYIFEGFKLQENASNNNSSTQPASTGTQYYKKPHAIGAIKPFIKLMTGIFVKLLPSVNSLLQIFTNPASFITTPVTEKLGNEFEFLSPEFLKEFNALVATAALADKLKAYNKSVLLKKYISLDADGKPRFILDGAALIELFGIKFGLEIKDVLLKLVFSGGASALQQNFNSLFNLNTSNVSQTANGIINSNFTQQVNNPNTTTFTGQQYETVSIEYSTGVKLDNVNYQYIYITEYVAGLLKAGEDAEKLNTPDSLNEAMMNYLLAYSSDSKNKLIQDKIRNLANKLKKLSEPILSFILGIVTLPIKLVKSIIDYIKSFFESLTNPAEIPSKIAEFISFKWFVKFFDVDNILGLAGIKLDIAAFNKIINDLPNLPPDYEIDLNQVIAAPFLPPFPIYKASQFKAVFKLPCELINSILRLFESVVNGIIEFIWSLINLQELIPLPVLNLTFPCVYPNDTKTTFSIKDLEAILANSSNGTLNDNPNFIYNIKLPDGRNIMDLNREELSNFIRDNQNLEFQFNFS